MRLYLHVQWPGPDVAQVAIVLPVPNTSRGFSHISRGPGALLLRK